MPFIENVSCGAEECHFNHANYCYRDAITLDISGTCEDFETCNNYDCNDCEYFDFCGKDKKYSSQAFGKESFFEEE